MQLVRDSKHRSDQWSAEIDGAVVAQAAGLTRLWALLNERFAKAPSKRALDSLHLGFSARDEEDARRADEEVHASDNKASPVV